MDDANWLVMGDREYEELIRRLFLNYRSCSRLMRSPLITSALVATCLLEGDETYPDARCYAMRAVLQWTLERLRARGTAWSHQSADLLVQRYVKGMSAKKYADEMLVSDATAQSRRRAAIRRVAGILRQQLQTPTEIVQLREWMIGLRYGGRPQEQQKTLRFLAVFRAPIPLSVRSPFAVEIFHACITQLCRVNLLQSNQTATQVTVHPEIRPYLLTLLPPDERSEWEQQAATHYEQHGDLLEAVYHWQMADHAQKAALLLIARPRERSKLPNALLRERLTAFKPGDLPLDLWAKLQILRGEVEEQISELKNAQQAYQEALGATDKGVKAEAYYRLGRIHRQIDPDAALIHFGHCERLLTDTTRPDHSELLAKVCISEAWVFIDHRPDAGQIEQNLARAEKAIPRATTERQATLLSDLNNARAAALYVLRDQQPTQYQEEYIECRWQAWHYAQEARDAVRIMNTGHNLGMAYMRQGQYQAAFPLFQESHELAERLGNRRMVSVNNKALGNWYVLSQSDYEQAIPYLTRAYEGLQEMENQFHLAAVCYDLAEVCALSGQGVVGRSYYDEGIRIARALGNEPLHAALETLARQCPELTLALNVRQQQAIGFMRVHGAVTNQEYRDLTDVSPRTAARDLNDLVDIGICKKVGQGRATRYQIALTVAA